MGRNPISSFCYNIFDILKLLFKNDRVFLQLGRVYIKNCKIDPGAFIYDHLGLESVQVGFGSAVGPKAFISFTEIGKFCSIGPNFFCGWGIHPTTGVSTCPSFYSDKGINGTVYSKVSKIEERKKIVIGNDVFIGANVTVLDGVTIGDGAVIGAGAVVSKDIPPYSVAVGCPIKIIKTRFSPEQIEQLLQLKWWDGDIEMMHKVESNFFDIEQFLEEAMPAERKHTKHVA